MANDAPLGSATPLPCPGVSSMQTLNAQTSRLRTALQRGESLVTRRSSVLGQSILCEGCCCGRMLSRLDRTVRSAQIAGDRTQFWTSGPPVVGPRWYGRPTASVRRRPRTPAAASGTRRPSPRAPDTNRPIARARQTGTLRESRSRSMGLWLDLFAERRLRPRAGNETSFRSSVYRHDSRLEIIIPYKTNGWPDLEIKLLACLRSASDG
jgi:hypothetical protein